MKCINAECRYNNDNKQKEELELESLKTKVLTAAKPTGMKESVVAPVAKPSLMPDSYPAVNSEMSKKAQVAEKAPGKKNRLSLPVESMTVNAKVT